MNIKGSVTNCVTRANIAPSARPVSLNISRVMQSTASIITSLKFKLRKTEEKLSKAIKNNDVPYLNQKLKRYPELAAKLLKDSDYEGIFTPLSLACHCGNLEAASELIQAGVDVSQVDDKGTSALMFAIKSGRVDTIKLLLAHKPNVNQVDNMGFSPLIMAVKSGSIDIIKLLLNHKPSVNQQSKTDCSAIAASDGNLEVLKILIEHGVDIFNETDELKNVLMTACEYGHLDIVRFLKTIGMNLNQQAMITKTTALHLAVKHGHKKVVDFLLKEGANPNLTDINGYSPLHLVKQNKGSQITQILMAHRAESNV